MEITKDEEIHGDSNVWSTAQRQNGAKDIMLMLGLNETVDHLAMANGICWY